MNQSRLESLLEAVVQTTIGLAVALVANPFVFPLFGWALSGTQSVGVALAFTAISLCRGYLVRRFFAVWWAPLRARFAAWLVTKVTVQLVVVGNTWTRYSPDNQPGTGYCADQGRENLLRKVWLVGGRRVWSRVVDREEVPAHAWISAGCFGDTGGWVSKFSGMPGVEWQ